ncbi:MAG: hypothetical protein ACLP78_07705 [Thermoplasmata archaeon]
MLGTGGPYDFERVGGRPLGTTMNLPYFLAFLALLVGYMIYSVEARLDPRYPVGAALVLLVVAAVADALGSTASANTFLEYVFLLLTGGVVLLLVDHLRSGRGSVGSIGAVASPGPAGQPVDERERPPDQPLDRPEQ